MSRITSGGEERLDCVFLNSFKVLFAKSEGWISTFTIILTL
jgi:hypothetical protein